VRARRDLLPVLGLLAALTLAGCGTSADEAGRGSGCGESCRGQVERLLGARLPDAVAELEYFRWQPSSQLSFATAYVKLEGSPGELLRLVRRLRLHRYGDAGARRYLPTGWQTLPGVTLSWWDASRATPRRSWAARFGVDGSIVAKLERGHLYAIVTDTGVARRE
jgi:hypothetical protein